MTVTQIYAKGVIRAFMALQIITGEKDCEIDYIREHLSAYPIEWIYN